MGFRLRVDGYLSVAGGRVSIQSAGKKKYYIYSLFTVFFSYKSIIQFAYFNAVTFSLYTGLGPSFCEVSSTMCEQQSSVPGNPG